MTTHHSRVVKSESGATRFAVWLHRLHWI